MADGDSDDRRLEFGTPQWEEERRRGIPRGDWVRPADSDEPMKASPFHHRADVSELVDLLHVMRNSDAAPPPAPAKGGWASAPVIIGMVVSVLSIGGSAAAVLQGYTQLGDRMASFGERMLTHDTRLSALESYQREGSADRAQLRAYNGTQDERFQNLTRALEQERQARIDGEVDIRRSESDLRAQGSELSKVLSEVRSDLKVLVDRAQRPHADIPGPPEHDAQLHGR